MLGGFGVLELGHRTLSSQGRLVTSVDLGGDVVDEGAAEGDLRCEISRTMTYCLEFTDRLAELLALSHIGDCIVWRSLSRLQRHGRDD
jgi:hypothetical protein